MVPAQPFNLLFSNIRRVVPTRRKHHKRFLETLLAEAQAHHNERKPDHLVDLVERYGDQVCALPSTMTESARRKECPLGRRNSTSSLFHRKLAANLAPRSKQEV